MDARPGRLRRRAPAEALLVLGALLLAPTEARAGGEMLSFSLSAAEQCAEGEIAADPGTLTAALAAEECTLSASGAEGGLDGFFSLARAIERRIPGPPEFFGFFREARVDATFLIPGRPPAGTEVLAAQLLNHLIVAWAFEEDGVAIAPIGDPILFFVPPAPPPFFAGAVLGRVRYGEPFEVSVGTTVDTHTITVRQGGSVVASALLKKIFAHPDRMTHASVFSATGTLLDLTLASFGPAEFRGVKSPAEATIAGAAVSQDPIIWRIERLGDEVRIWLRPASPSAARGDPDSFAR